MGIQIGGKPESSFAQPIGLLSDCHRRIEKFLHALLAVTQQAQGGPLSEGQRRTLETALRYFREAAPRHTRDEEDSLFPKMRQSGDAAVQAALAAIDALEADHQRADTGHLIVEELGQKWLAQEHLSPEETARLAGTLQELESLYANHLQVEDTQIFPLAAQVLNAEIISNIGREMAERRGIDLDALPDMQLRCPTRSDRAA